MTSLFSRMAIEGSIYDTLYVARLSRDSGATGEDVHAGIPIDIYDAAQSRQVDVPALGKDLEPPFPRSEE